MLRTLSPTQSHGKISLENVFINTVNKQVSFKDNWKQDNRHLRPDSGNISARVSMAPEDLLCQMGDFASKYKYRAGDKQIQVKATFADGDTHAVSIKSLMIFHSL
jgi:hypothetical protein